MSINELQYTFNANGLSEPLSNAINGSIPLETTLSGASICGMMCAACIIGFFVI